MRTSLNKRSWRESLAPEVLWFERTKTCFEQIEQDSRLSYRLPPKNSLAGRIMKHCFDVVDATIEKHQPLIFKVGYTHCAYTRFYNDKFGYVHEKASWEYMVVLYAAGETVSPAFVEAALIQHYKGHWDFAKIFFLLKFVVV